MVLITEKYKLVDENQKLKDILGWNWISCSATKVPWENNLQYLDALLQCSPQYWKTDGIKLFKIAKESIGYDGNQIKSLFEMLGDAAARCSFNDYVQFICYFNLLNYECNEIIYLSMFDGIISYLETAEINREDLLLIWSISITGLSWRVREDRIYIEDIKKAILKTAARLGYEKFYLEIRNIAPIYFELSQKRGRVNTNKWIYKNIHECSKKQKDKTKNNVDYSIDELYTQLYYASIYDATSRDSIDFAGLLINRMTKEQTKDYNLYLKKILDVIKINEHSYSPFEGRMKHIYSDVIYNLFKSNREWDLVNIVLSRESLEQKSLDDISNRIEHILFYRSQLFGKDSLSLMLNSNMDMIILWIEGNKKLKQINTDVITQDNENETKLSWKDLAAGIIMKSISSKNNYRIEAGIKGAWQLLCLDNSLVTTLIERWKNLNLIGTYYGVILLKMIIINLPEYLNELNSVAEYYIYNRYPLEMLYSFRKNITVNERRMSVISKSTKFKKNFLISVFNKKIQYIILFNKLIDSYALYSSYFFCSPKIVVDKNRWYNCYQLTRVISGNECRNKAVVSKQDIKHRFRKHINSKINRDDQIVIYAIIVFYSILQTYFYTYKSIEKGKIDLFNLSTTNINPYSPINIAPYGRLKKWCTLRLASNGLPEYTFKGNRVMWLEIYNGPIQDDMPDDRQNILYRWICTKKFYSYISKKIGGITFMDELTESEAGSEIGYSGIDDIFFF